MKIHADTALVSTHDNRRDYLIDRWRFRATSDPWKDSVDLFRRWLDRCITAFRSCSAWRKLLGFHLSKASFSTLHAQTRSTDETGSTLLATIGIDITFNIASIFITTSLPRARQGLAGGLINSILHLGITFCLGFSDIIQAETVDRVGLFKSYKAIFWFGVAAASVALFLMAFFVKIEKAKSDLTADEKRELEQAALKEQQSSAT